MDRDFKYKISLLISILKLAIKTPSAFIKQINLDNWKTFIRASENEEGKELLSNAKILLNKTKKDNFQQTLELTKTFLNNVEDNSTNKDFAILISHEATRTGAPLILLKIAQHLSRSYTPILLLCKGGEMENDFKSVGHTYLIQFPHNNFLLGKEISTITNKLKAIGNIKRVYVNSEGSTRLLKFLSKENIRPIITLIHEMGSYYPKKSWNHISKHSDHVVFPANSIKELAVQNSYFDPSKIKVLGQGLLKEELITQDLDRSRSEIRQELKISQDSKIILGCGTPIPRKGIDIFILIAISVLNRLAEKNINHVHFIWLGAAPNNEHQIWAGRDIKHSDKNENIHMIGSRNNTIPYFLGSDIFLMTSRGDPFPCVIHEAQASGMPVFAFDNTGGIPEMLNPDFDYLFPYGDIVSFVDKLLAQILNLDQNDKKRLEIRKIAKQELSFKKYISNLENLK